MIQPTKTHQRAPFWNMLCALETFAEAAARLRARTSPRTADSADLIRQDRDRVHDGLPR
jgi:hypothetical protein